MGINRIISKILILYLSIYLILFMAFYCLMPLYFNACGEEDIIKKPPMLIWERCRKPISRIGGGSNEQ